MRTEKGVPTVHYRNASGVISKDHNFKFLRYFINTYIFIFSIFKNQTGFWPV